MPSDALIGHTGFVGGNLMQQHEFSETFNSSNIDEIRGKSFRNLVCAGVPATMWLANAHPDQDRSGIRSLYEKMIGAKADFFVLISTIAVYSDTRVGMDETSDGFEEVSAYGKHRRELERDILDHFGSALIVRLPALFGTNIKKNFIHDLLNPIPQFLKPEAMTALCDAADWAKDEIKSSFHWSEEARMWKFDANSPVRRIVEEAVERTGMTARNFTHPDSRFQFYDLSTLWSDILAAREAGVRVLNMATEPISASQVASQVFGREMTARSAPVIGQNMLSVHAELFGGKEGYLQNRDTILEKLSRFRDANR